jgi:hypothetical protein
LRLHHLIVRTPFVRHSKVGKVCQIAAHRLQRGRIKLRKKVKVTGSWLLVPG